MTSNLENQIHRMLQGNQVTIRYSRPSPLAYQHQWLWDSCFHAITYRWLDPQMARDELSSLVGHQVNSGPDAGMIPHMNYWYPDPVGYALWGQIDRSVITQPPLIAVAAMLVHEVASDLDWLRTLYTPLTQYHLWFERRRDPDGDGLVCLIHPWESGWDASPRWDDALKVDLHVSDETLRARRVALTHTIRDYDTDAVKLAADGHFCMETSDFNAIRAADLEALAQMAKVLGNQRDCDKWLREADRVKSAIRRKLLKEGRVYDLSGPDEKVIDSENAGEFVLLFGGCVDQAEADALVKRLTEPRFWTEYPVTTVPTDSPAYSPDRYWRGNVWWSVNWLIFKGLLRYGYTDQARHLAAKSAELAEQHGLYEYFNPDTGAGLGEDQQSWAGVAVDMLRTLEALN